MKIKIDGWEIQRVLIPNEDPRKKPRAKYFPLEEIVAEGQELKYLAESKLPGVDHVMGSLEELTTEALNGRIRGFGYKHKAIAFALAKGGEEL